MSRPIALLRQVLVGGLAAALGLTLIAPSLASAATTTPSVSSAASETPAEAELGFLRLLNQARTAAGLAPVHADVALANTSRSWSSTMASRGQLVHDPNLAAIISRIEPAWTSAAENVGVGYGVQSLHDAFMASSGHRANVLTAGFNRVGIGVVLSGEKIWVTVRFIAGPALLGATGLEPTRAVAPAVPLQPISHACPTLPVVPFVDVPGTTHAKGVACAWVREIASGRTASTYAPNARVTRAQMATFLANLLTQAGVTLPAAPADAFSDDDGSLHEEAINQLAALGVVQGRRDGTFGANETVTRAAMATFLVRAHDEAAPESPLPAGVDRFWDDDTSNHEANIDKVGQAGLAAGMTSTRFAPAASVTRGQMATFVSRTLDQLVEDGVVPAP